MKHGEMLAVSALSGQAWLIKLLIGHPEWICCELGMHAIAFTRLINELCELKHDDSRYVMLKEQVAIFLYMSVTGLTIRHAGKRFQHSNETISWYVFRVVRSSMPTDLFQLLLQDGFYVFIRSFLSMLCSDAC